MAERGPRRQLQRPCARTESAAVSGWRQQPPQRSSRRIPHWSLFCFVLSLTSTQLLFSLNNMNQFFSLLVQGILLHLDACSPQANPSSCLSPAHFPHSIWSDLLTFYEIMAVTGVNRIVQVSSVHFCDTTSAYCTVGPPTQVQPSAAMCQASTPTLPFRFPLQPPLCRPCLWDDLPEAQTRLLPVRSHQCLLLPLGTSPNSAHHVQPSAVGASDPLATLVTSHWPNPNKHPLPQTQHTLVHTE